MCLSTCEHSTHNTVLRANSSLSESSLTARWRDLGAHPSIIIHYEDGALERERRKIYI